MANPRVCATDVDNYGELANAIFERGIYGYDSHLHGLVGDGQPTAQRPPLYPLLLAAWALPVSLQRLPAVDGDWTFVLHLLLGTFTVWLVARLGRHWDLGRWRFLAAGLVAFDPILLKQSTVVMTETLAAFLAALALFALTEVVNRPTALRALAAGAAFGFAVLCRPTFLVWAVCAAPALWWLLPRVAHRIRTVAFVCCAGAAVVAPWAIRNEIQFGRPIITTTHGGFTLLLANNPEFYKHLRTAPREPWDATAFNRSFGLSSRPHNAAGEITNDRANYALAWQAILNEPSMFLRACIYRLSRLWGVLPLALPAQGPREQQLRYATAAWYTLEFALAVVGLWSLCRRDARTTKGAMTISCGAGVSPAAACCGAGVSPAFLRRPLFTTSWLFGLLLAASFTAVHALYWTDMRMRAPLMPVVALAAAAGASWTYVRIARRNHHDAK